MKELNLEEIKQIELEILSCFDKFCGDNGLRYSLAYGTLIGAIRHKGFIPWDDDIDVWMPRPDYDLFVRTFNNDRFKLLCHEKCDYWQEFGKLTDVTTEAHPTNNKAMGVFIDVFPVDGLPYNPDSFKKAMRNRFAFFSRMRKVNIWKIRGGLSDLVFKTIELFYPTEKILRQFETKKQSCCFDKSTQSWDLYTQFDSSDFDDFIKVCFEGKSFCALRNYDRYLRAYYGDYMQLPPLEKRISVHQYKFYLKN